MRLQSPSHSGAAAYTVWVWQLSRTIWKRAPGKLAVATLARVAAQFAQIFSFFIPLKIIILIGTTHIPNYIAGVMTPQNRDAWIMGMAVATLVLYVAAILLELISGRMEGRAARQFLQAMGESFAPEKPQRSLVQRMVVLLTRIHVAAAILGLCLVSILIINPLMLLALMALIVIQLVLTVWSARHPAARWLGWPGRSALHNPERYFRMLAALDFMAVFGLLLAEYWIVGSSEMLTAILILLLGRRLFQSAAVAARRMVILQREHENISALFNPKPIPQETR